MILTRWTLKTSTSKKHNVLVDSFSVSSLRAVNHAMRRSQDQFITTRQATAWYPHRQHGVYSTSTTNRLDGPSVVSLTQSYLWDRASLSPDLPRCPLYGITQLTVFLTDAGAPTAAFSRTMFVYSYQATCFLLCLASLKPWRLLLPNGRGVSLYNAIPNLQPRFENNRFHPSLHSRRRSLGSINQRFRGVFYPAAPQRYSTN